MPDAMHDRGRFWTPVPDWREVALDGDGWRVRRVAGLCQTLVSGDLAAATAALAPGAGAVGLWGIAAGEAAVVRIARDRALVVSSSPAEIAPGWHGGFAASPCDDAWAVIGLSGPGIGALAAEGTAAALDGGSPSASVMFAGVPCLLYRTAPQAARLHVESPFAAYIWTWLEGCVGPVNGPAANPSPDNEGA